MVTAATADGGASPIRGLVAGRGRQEEVVASHAR